jgi:hypothetical protein
MNYGLRDIDVFPQKQRGSGRRYSRGLVSKKIAVTYFIAFPILVR